MRKNCAVCSEPFDAKRQTAKYCSRRCSMRASRSRERQPKRERQLVVSGVAPATLTELEAAGRTDSASGQAALALASRIDLGLAETASGLASLVREHRAALADAVKTARSASNPLDELRSRRERKHRQAG